MAGNPQDAYNFAALLGSAAGYTPDQSVAAASGPVVQAPTASYYAKGGNQANAYNGGAPLSPLEQAMSYYTQGYGAVSGAYGQNGADDAAADAAMIAKAVPGHPIRLQWMREQEFGWEPLGPAMVTELEA